MSSILAEELVTHTRIYHSTLYYLYLLIEHIISGIHPNPDSTVWFLCDSVEFLCVFQWVFQSEVLVYVSVWSSCVYFSVGFLCMFQCGVFVYVSVWGSCICFSVRFLYMFQCEVLVYVSVWVLVYVQCGFFVYVSV